MKSATIAVVAMLTPALAQDAFQPGQDVQSSEKGMMAACTTQDAARAYGAALDRCAFADSSSCETAEDLEKRGICNPHDKTFVVLSVDAASGLVRISPIGDSSRTYWAAPDDLEPAQ